MLVALAFLPLAVAMKRNVPTFALLALPALARLLTRARSDKPAWSWPVANSAVGALLACAALGFVFAAYRLPAPGLEWHPLSTEAVAAVRASPEPTYTAYGVGGYLIWFTPERKVLFDSRQDPYPRDLLLEGRQVERTGRHRELFARFAIRSALLEAASPVRASLLADGWRETWADDAWAVLVAP